MAAQGRYTLRNILEGVPGITGGEAVSSGASFGSGTDNPAGGLVFRGIPSNLGTGGSITSTAPAAAIYVDEIYNGIGGGYDFERVEVLRGPQGTLYGRSATSGVVTIKTRDPNTSEFEGDIALETGTGNLEHYTGGVNIPLVTDKLALRVSGNYYDREGYRISPGDDRTNKDFRAKLLVTPTDNVSILLGYAQQDNETQSGGGSFNQFSPDQFAFIPATPPGSFSAGENNFRQYWAQVNWDLGSVAMTYIPAVRKWEQNALITLPPPLFGIQTIRTPESKFTTHELRFASDYDSTLQWQFGASHYENKLNDFNELVTLPPTVPAGLAFRSVTQKSTKAYGAFGEATWSFQPDTRLTAGLRFDHTEVQIDQCYTSILLLTACIPSPSESGIRDFDNVTYKVRLEHDLTSSNLIYASVSTGFSPGDVTLGTNAFLQPDVKLLDAETLTAYEVGSKNRFLDNRLQLNGSIYFNDYSAYQLANVDFAPAGQPPRFETVAMPLKSFGAELEMLALPWAGGTIGVNLSYTDANFERSALPASYQAQFYTDRVYGIPKVRGSVSYDHRLEFGSGGYALMLHGDVVYSSEYDTGRISVANVTPSPSVPLGFKPYVNQGALALGNLSATLQFAEGRYGITGYVRNVTDKEYKRSAFGPTSTTPFSPLAATAELADPRVWGVILNARF
jgi:iron complex outermembrane receptor protein